ncbi:hypothetical protein [Dokdonia sp.]|uniref:tetratricopeptide repeat protein n=1 Tax=Dokdonia sp. TaxID=2024995 RepID=UPI0032658674
MNENELEHDIIERYLRKEMTPGEQTLFEKNIKENPNLKEQIALYKALYSIPENDDWFEFNGDSDVVKKEASLFRSQETLEFSERLKKFRNTTNPKQKKKIFNIQLLSTVAAVIIIAIFIFYPKDYDPASLFEQYHNWDELPSYVSKGDSNSDIYKELELLFHAKEYQNVITQANTLDASVYEFDQQAILFVGVSHLELHQYEKALKIFDSLLQSNSIDAHKGHWYKVLTFLKQGNKEKAIQTLEIISNNSAYYKHNEAKELLKKLE